MPELPHNRESCCIFGVTLLKDASHDSFTAALPSYEGRQIQITALCARVKHAALLKSCMKKLFGHLNLQQAGIRRRARPSRPLIGQVWRL